MIIKKTQYPTEYRNPHKTTIYYYKKQNIKNTKDFQKELFEFIEKENIHKSSNIIVKENIDLENEVKKMFLGDIVKKDHLFSSSLSEIQKENIIKISQLYY